MKVFALSAVAMAAAEEGSPIGKVIQMIADLQSKVMGEGQVAQTEYEEFAGWCEENAKNLQNEIKVGKSTVDELKATLEEETAKTAALNTKIEELAASIETDEADLKAATAVRNKEAADFAAEEKELVDVIDVINRAVGILEKEMAKSGASMLQAKDVTGVAQALGALVQASALSTADASKLSSFVQSRSSDEDDMTGAPAAATYKSQSGGIVDVLSDLKEKAEGELAEARKAESTTKHNFEMMKQSLEDQMAADTKDLNEEKSAKEAAEEGKATAEGDLATTVKELAQAEKDLATSNIDCMTTAADHEASVAAREEDKDSLTSTIRWSSTIILLYSSRNSLAVPTSSARVFCAEPCISFNCWLCRASHPSKTVGMLKGDGSSFELKSTASGTLCGSLPTAASTKG